MRLRAFVVVILSFFTLSPVRADLPPQIAALIAAVESRLNTHINGNWRDKEIERAYQDIAAAFFQLRGRSEFILPGTEGLTVQQANLLRLHAMQEMQASPTANEETMIRLRQAGIIHYGVAPHQNAEALEHFRDFRDLNTENRILAAKALREMAKRIEKLAFPETHQTRAGEKVPVTQAVFRRMQADLAAFEQHETPAVPVVRARPVETSPQERQTSAPTHTNPRPETTVASSLEDAELRNKVITLLNHYQELKEIANRYDVASEESHAEPESVTSRNQARLGALAALEAFNRGETLGPAQVSAINNLSRAFGHSGYSPGSEPTTMEDRLAELPAAEALKRLQAEVRRLTEELKKKDLESWEKTVVAKAAKEALFSVKASNGKVALGEPSLLEKALSKLSDWWAERAEKKRATARENTVLRAERARERAVRAENREREREARRDRADEERRARERAKERASHSYSTSYSNGSKGADMAFGCAQGLLALAGIGVLGTVATVSGVLIYESYTTRAYLHEYNADTVNTASFENLLQILEGDPRWSPTPHEREWALATIINRYVGRNLKYVTFDVQMRIADAIHAGKINFPEPHHYPDVDEKLASLIVPSPDQGTYEASALRRQVHDILDNASVAPSIRAHLTQVLVSQKNSKPAEFYEAEAKVRALYHLLAREQDPELQKLGRQAIGNLEREMEKYDDRFRDLPDDVRLNVKLALVQHIQSEKETVYDPHRSYNPKSGLDLALFLGQSQRAELLFQAMNVASFKEAIMNSKHKRATIERVLNAADYERSRQIFRSE